MAQQRMHAREFFGDGERVVAPRDAKMRERGHNALGNRRARQRVRKRLEFGVAFECGVRCFIGGDEH